MLRRPPRSTPFPTRRSSDLILPIIQEVLGDAAATTHKLKFFENGATPNIVVSLDKSITDRKSTRLNSSHTVISYAVFCLKKKNTRAWRPPWLRVRRAA